MVKPELKQTMYYARIIPNQHIYDVCDVLIRTITDTYFVGMDKRTKQAFVFTGNIHRKTKSSQCYSI